ncbi:MAG: helix-turn-helix transcriptional regulator [Bdellovibrionota bacterium]
MEKIKVVLSANMKSYRTHHKMSQLILAEKSNLSVQMIRDIEAGRRWPSANSFEFIARGLEVRVGDLLQEFPKSQSNPSELKKALKIICEIYGYDIIKLK